MLLWWQNRPGDKGTSNSLWLKLRSLSEFSLNHVLFLWACVHVCVRVCYLQSLQRALHLTSYTRVGPFEWCVTCQLARAATLSTLLHSSHGSAVPGLLASPLYVAPVQIWDVWVSQGRGWGKPVKTWVWLGWILEGESPNIKGKLGTCRVTPRSSLCSHFYCIWLMNFSFFKIEFNYLLHLILIL